MSAPAVGPDADWTAMADRAQRWCRHLARWWATARREGAPEASYFHERLRVTASRVHEYRARARLAELGWSWPKVGDRLEVCQAGIYPETRWRAATVSSVFGLCAYVRTDDGDTDVAVIPAESWRPISALEAA